MRIVTLNKISEGSKDLYSAPCEICGFVKKDCAVVNAEAITKTGDRFKVYALICEDHFAEGEFFKGNVDAKAKDIIEKVEILARIMELPIEKIKTLNTWLDEKYGVMEERGFDGESV